MILFDIASKMTIIVGYMLRYTVCKWECGRVVNGQVSQKYCQVKSM